MNADFPRWEDVTITNDFFFAYSMLHDTELCRLLLRTLLKLDAKEITYVNTQETLAAAPGSKSVRLDVLLETTGEIVNVEMQTTSEPNLFKRIRYYQSSIDIGTAQRGVDYDDLKKLYVLFICTKDPFGEGLPRYTLRTVCDEHTALDVRDERFAVVYNASAYENELDSETAAMLHYIAEGGTDTETAKSFAERVFKLKTDGAAKGVFMKYEIEIKRIRKEGFAEGLTEGESLGFAAGESSGMAKGEIRGMEKGRISGIAEEKYATAGNLLSMGVLTPEQIAAATELPLETVQELACREE
ncbi:Rpn family recombination-promoting nuclease/putative transposase [Treponema brennaborense]|uniref:Tetracycline resistance leader peptide n=1 Tax=Treponema brennaborense (strain DSM 12168 / CIP 105900 / DD5/3) TaxID=906968 RepID=F4LJE8_TREBD|nr:Rpn family recombination-promoting nuclease/putative transposase [Treponema brennaborense]AEE17393.1 tetracycline resistance leader peptide [Treponema brennaborense DSM 12168]